MNILKTIGLVASVGAVGFGPAFAQDAAPRPAKVATVSETSGEISRSYPAVVLPSREIELSFKVSGQVIELPIRAAMEVKEGDVIAQIDTRDFESQVAQLQSQRDQANAQLTALEAGARVEEISAAEASVESATAQLDQARDALERAEQLLERGVSTQTQVDDARADFRVAAANLRAQEEQLRIAQIGGRPEEVEAAEAALRGIDAQLKVANDSLADATLTAPFDGIIARREIENFTNVQAGQDIALLQRLSVIHLAFDLPSSDVVDLTRNGPDNIVIVASFDMFPGEVFETEPVEFSVQADSATQTYRGRVSIEVPENAVILPGMVASVTTMAAGPAAQVVAPLSAIASDSESAPFVWTVDEAGVVSMQKVSLGAATGGNIVIEEGLSDGDVIVAAGVGEIIDGMTIRPITEIGN